MIAYYSFLKEVCNIQKLFLDKIDKLKEDVGLFLFFLTATHYPFMFLILFSD